jgi:hypothetical protein
MITHFMGKPLPGQEPIRRIGSEQAFWLGFIGLIFFPLLALGSTCLGLVISTITTYIAAVFMIGLFRKFQLEYGHYASHRNFIVKDREKNEFYLNLSTSIALCQNGTEYRRDHNIHHNKTIFTTNGDSDAAFLMRLGFRPGLSRFRLWSLFIFTMFSPYFHGYFLSTRLNSALITRQSSAWKIASFAWLTIILLLPLILPTWIVVFTICLPLTIFYQMSALCQFLTEHVWLMTKSAPEDEAAYAERCWGRFLGEPLPDVSGVLALSRLALWSGVTLRYLLLHFPGRYAVLVGDMPAHDWHHLARYMGMSGRNCPAGIYERQRGIELGDKCHMAERELWGITSMIDHVFGILERAENDTASDPVDQARAGNFQPSRLLPRLVARNNGIGIRNRVC